MSKILLNSSFNRRKNNFLKQTKNKNGITLIALIITIIILLILAGTAIAFAVNSDNIFKKTEDAKNKWGYAVNQEQSSIRNLLDEVVEYETGIEVVRGELYDWVVEGNAVVKYLGHATDLVIPNMVGDTKITEIGDFLYRGGATSGDVQENMANVHSIEISRGIETIGINAFQNLTGVNGKLVIPDTVRTIKSGPSTFINTKFNGLEINMKEIPAGLFAENSGITGSVTIGENVEKIGAGAFYYCTGLNGKLTIMKNVKTIEGNAFYGTKFNGIEIDCKEIPPKLFANNSSITGDLIIGNNVETIGDEAFNYCYCLSGNLSLGNNLKHIGDKAFYNCYGFTGDLIIPDNVTSIGEYAFYYCGGFDGTITFGNSIETIGQCAFYNCNKIVGGLTFPESITFMGNSAFYNCTSLDGDIIINGHVQEINPSTFYGCEKVSGFILDADTIIFDNYSFDSSPNLTIVKLNGNVVRIKGMAFAYSSKLEYVEINASETIALNENSDPFYSCYNLENVKLHGGNIYMKNGFYSCQKLKNAYIEGDTINFNRDFTWGYALENVTIKGNSITFSSSPFEGCTSLKNLRVIGNVNNFGSAPLLSWTSNNATDIVFDGNITTLNQHISTAKGMGSLTFNGDIQYIYKNLFSNDNCGIKTIVFNGNVSSYPDGLLSNQPTLTTVVLPKNITEIRKDTFSGCSGLSDIYYSATKAQWNAMNKYTGNDYLQQANIHCSDGDITPTT